MKYILLTLTVLSLLPISSCKKTYTCVCTGTLNFREERIVGPATKEEAKQQCDYAETDISSVHAKTNSNVKNVTCNIE